MDRFRLPEFSARVFRGVGTEINGLAGVRWTKKKHIMITCKKDGFIQNSTPLSGLQAKGRSFTTIPPTDLSHVVIAHDLRLLDDNRVIPSVIRCDVLAIFRGFRGDQHRRICGSSSMVKQYHAASVT